MTAVTLHYLHDPLCGWCYAVAPLIRAARTQLPVALHAGGLMTGARRQAVSASWRDFVRPHDERIAQLSGQTFGEGYRDGLLRDTTAVLDSEPPIAAVLAADQLAGRGLDLLGRLQTAHYVEGLQIARPEVLVSLAADLGLPAAAFADALDRQRGDATRAHIAATRQLMQRTGAQGFPSLLLEQQGRFTALAWQPYLGQPAAFLSAFLAAWGDQLPAGSQPRAPAAMAAGTICHPDACAPRAPS